MPLPRPSARALLDLHMNAVGEYNRAAQFLIKVRDTPDQAGDPWSADTRQRVTTLLNEVVSTYEWRIEQLADMARGVEAGEREALRFGQAVRRQRYDTPAPGVYSSDQGGDAA